MGKLVKINRSKAGFIDAAPISQPDLLCADVFEVSEAECCGTLVEGTDGAIINAGAYMKEGKITFSGSVGANAGKGMNEGTLVIEGDAGMNGCASMQGGLAVFHGNVDSGFGKDMRRGIAVVYGRAEGDLCTDMLGGTVIFLGGVAEDAMLCTNMNRGTVILPSKDMVPAGFQKAADVDIMFLRVLFNELRERGVEVPEGWMGHPFTRWRGDMAALGKGEILTPAED